MKLTKGDRAFLQLVAALPNARVFPDQRSAATKLEVFGLIECTGGYLDTHAVVTQAGRAALAKSRETK